MAARAWLPLVLAAAAACGTSTTPDRAVRGGLDTRPLIDVLPVDAIRAIAAPEFDPIDAATWLTPDSPVIAVAVEAVARAYPLAILVRHEVVNDEVAGDKIAVTYCPLCNSAAVFRRSLGGRTLTFGVSGKLYHSSLVLYDRQTESLWPQMLGVAVAGPSSGQVLERIPAAIVSFEDFRMSFPSGEVLRRPAGADYAETPYGGYDSRSSPIEPFFRTRPDRRLPAMARVVGVDAPRARAYRFPSGERTDVIVDEDRDVVVLFAPTARSPLDQEVIADSRRVGAAGVFRPRTVGHDRLTIRADSKGFTDGETGSRWSVLGVAVEGPLRGRRLEPVLHTDAFWFSWTAFHPETEVWPR